MGLLTLGPKFCILNDLVEETFEKEIEECIVKLRWETTNDEKKKKEDKKFGEEALAAINLLFDEDELREHENEETIEEARTRMTYDEDKNSMNMAKKKVTDCKGNSRVIFLRNLGNFDFESRLDLF